MIYVFIADDILQELKPVENVIEYAKNKHFKIDKCEFENDTLLYIGTDDEYSLERVYK